jgi:acyl-coenzyme A thioesterase PaaI-like protein
LAAASMIRSAWNRLAALPGGRWAFGILLGRLAPYTGSIQPRVLELREGYARVGMADRRVVRNHLDSIHAVALVNLGEVATGLALHYALPEHARAILTGLSIDFLKKGRGYLEAEASAPVPDGHASEEITLRATIRDRSGDEVAHFTARWLVGPRKPRPERARDTA